MNGEPQSANFGVSRILFSLWALFWLLMVLIAVEDHRGESGIEWWEPFVWEGSSCVVGTAWLLLQRRVADRWDEHLGNPLRWFGRHAAWLPLVMLTFVALVYAIRHGIYAFTGEIYQHRPWPQLFFYESIKVLLYAGLWIGIIFGLASFASWRHERERLLALQKHLAESQLAHLKAQLQPHFLFNALNTISSLMQVDVERADRLLTMLADLLRATLQGGERQTTSLREELDFLGLYARIMQERFAGRVTLRWDVQEAAADALIPTMLLQPLLENAYKHGVERTAATVAITITARRDDDRLLVTLQNSGELSDASPPGIGLRNCRERLAALYGTAAALTLTAEGGEVIARLALPYQRHAP